MIVDTVKILEAMRLERELGIVIRSPELAEGARQLARFHRDGNRAMRRRAERLRKRA